MSENYQSLPKGWYKPSLSELGSICTGNTPPTSDSSYYSGDLPFVGPSDLGRGRWIDSCSEKLTRKGELLSRTANKDAVLVSCIGVLGKVGQAKEKLSFNQQVNSIQPDEDKVDAGFLYYASSRLQGELNKLAGLQVVPIVNKTLFSKLEILAPKRLVEQRWIANILDTLDTQIQKTEALIAKLEKVKEGLLHDLLTRGIDENGQLRPSPEQAPELYKESPLGLVPKEWQCLPLEEVVNIHLGFAFSASDYCSSGIPSFRVSDIGKNIANKSEMVLLPWRFWGKHKRQQLFGSEIVLVMVGATTGKLGRVPASICPALQNQNMWRIEPNPPMSKDYLYSILPDAISRHMRMSQGSARDFLSQKDFLKTLVAAAPEREQGKIVNIVNDMEGKINHEKEILEKNKQLKNGLMDDLLTGRVSVIPLLEQAQATTPA